MLMRAVIWMNLEHVMPSDRSRSQRVTYDGILSYKMSRTDPSADEGAGQRLPRGGRGEQGVVTTGCGVLLWGSRVLKLERGCGCTTLNVLNARTCTL